MGNDVTLVATDSAEEYLPRHASHVWIAECTQRVRLFWLCCFRLTDYKEDRETGWRYLCCPFDKAIEQLHQGVEILQKSYPKAFVGDIFRDIEIPRMIQHFTEFLEGHRKKFLTLETWQCDEPSFEIMLQHCLAGFWHPNCQYYYDPKAIASWSRSFVPPHESGIMGWAGALRRLCTSCQNELIDSVSGKLFFDEYNADYELTGTVMPHVPPTRIAINRDDHHAKHVGRTSDGRQFFLATPSEPADGGKAGCEYAALFLFDSSGLFLEAKIESFGRRASLDEAKRDACCVEWLRELGDVSFGRIEVAPFSLERFGTVFGLVLRPPEDDSYGWWVELQPGNSMTFQEPWDSGEYEA